jgi:hypothetical protein
MIEKMQQIRFMKVAKCPERFLTVRAQRLLSYSITSVADPDPDPHVFGHPGSRSDSFYH